jgi:transcription elongation factor Elf1
VDKVVLTLSTIDYVYPSHIPLVFKSRPLRMLVPNYSLMVFCNCSKLVGTLHVTQIRFLIACWWSGLGCTYSLNHLIRSSIQYVHPSPIPLVFKSRPLRMLVPNYSLTVFCNCSKLVRTLHETQICFLIACCWCGQSCTYSINLLLCSSIPYSSSFQI